MSEHRFSIRKTGGPLLLAPPKKKRVTTRDQNAGDSLSPTPLHPMANAHEGASDVCRASEAAEDHAIYVAAMRQHLQAIARLSPFSRDRSKQYHQRMCAKRVRRRRSWAEKVLPVTSVSIGPADAPLRPRAVGGLAVDVACCARTA